MTRPERRHIQLFAFLAAWAIVVVARLVQVQLIKHEHYTRRALKQQERTLSLNPVRGAILDSRMRTLAESVSAESIYADPQAIASRDRRATARALASVPGISVSAREIEQKLASDAGFVWIARQLPMAVAAKARALELSGVYFLDEHRRSYPRGTLAANVIGYVGLDGEGLAGIEHAFDSHVRGRPARVTVLQDARRGAYLVGAEGANRPLDGKNVILTIDSVVQFITEKALARQIEKYNAAAGSAIVMDATSGAILAMVSLPTFDPGRFREFPPAAWRNRTVQDTYEPGSTFKIVTAAAGLEEGLVTPSQMIDCEDGEIRIASIAIHEHGGNRFGLLSFEDVMVNSSNVGTIKVGLSLGPSRFYDYIQRFGFGSRTGVELPGEEGGLLRRTSKWSQVSNASISIGQEVGVTPLQVVRAFATVANGGMRVEPHIVDRVVGEDGKVAVRRRPAAPVRVISERTAAVLNEILKSVVARGTGEKAALAEHIVAGKTGTAQKAVRGGYSPDKFVASFAGYVPADRPRLVILVVVDEPRGAQYGGTIAAPAFREIAEASLRYLDVQPSIPLRTLDPKPPLLAGISQTEPVRTAVTGVPDFRGLDLRAAVARATAAGLLVEAIGSGVVQTQNPMAGEALPRDKRVTFHLSHTPDSGFTAGPQARRPAGGRPPEAGQRSLTTSLEGAP